MKKPNHLCPLCPMCGAYSPRTCDLEEECCGVCPWVESGQYERDCAMADDDEDDQL